MDERTPPPEPSEETSEVQPPEELDDEQLDDVSGGAYNAPSMYPSMNTGP